METLSKQLTCKFSIKDERVHITHITHIAHCKYRKYMHTLRYSRRPPTRKAMSASVRVTRYALMDCIEVLVSSQLSSTTRLTTFTARPRLVMAGVNCAWKKRLTSASVVSDAIHETRVKNMRRGSKGWSLDVIQLGIVHSELEALRRVGP